jgi:hypothetical protein
LVVPFNDEVDEDLQNTDCDLEGPEGDALLCCLLGEPPYCDTVVLKEYPNMHTALKRFNYF